MCQRIRAGFGFYARHSHKQRRMTAHCDLFVEFDNVGVAELAQELTFFVETVVHAGLKGDLEHTRLTVALD